MGVLRQGLLQAFAFYTAFTHRTLRNNADTAANGMENVTSVAAASSIADLPYTPLANGIASVASASSIPSMSEDRKTNKKQHLHVYTHPYIYIYMCR